MLDKIIEKFLDFLIENKIVESLESFSFFQKFIKILKDKTFMIHIIKYLFFGVVTTVLCLASFWILIETTTLDENLCNLLSIAVGILIAYVLNREYVFESKEKNILGEFFKFAMARIASSLFDIITFFIFATCLDFNEMIVKTIIQVVVIILNYILSKLLVFRKVSNENVK